MNSVDQALRLVGHWLVWLLSLVLAVFGVVEVALRGLMFRLRISEQLQTIIMVVLAVVLIITAIRLLGGVFRVLIALFLILLLLHMLVGGGTVHI